MFVEIFLFMHPALVPVFIREFDLTIFQAGLLITIPNVCRLIVGIIAGVLSDRLGPRILLILSVMMGGFSAFLVSQSINVSILIIALSLLMISVTVYHPPGLSIIGKLFPNTEERTKAIGLHGSAGCLGQSLGTLSLGFLMLKIGWRFCYLLLSIPLLFWMVVLTLIKFPNLTESSNSPSKRQDSMRKKSNPPPIVNVTVGFAILLFTMGFWSLGGSGVSTFMTTYLVSVRKISEASASLIFGTGPLIGVFGSLVGGYLGSRLGEKNSITVVFVGQMIFLLILIFVPSIALFVSSFLMYKLLQAALWTPTTSMVPNLSGKIGGGTAYSLYYFVPQALGAVSPTLSALLINRFGIWSPFFFAMSLFLVCAVLIQSIKSK